jgi:GNAT superfamily N-acetyltransferase
MTVRLAVASDWPAVSGLFHACWQSSAYTEEFDPESVFFLFSHGCQGQDMACFVNDGVTGFLFLGLTPSHFNFGVTYANEMAFWGKDGRDLIRAGAEWARSRGAVRLRMASEDHIKGKAMDRFYRMNGLHPVGRSYAMTLEPENGH